jgi:hypothetical protein
VTRLRCAIYTRKSTEEGLEQEFNTLDAQREAGEAYLVDSLPQPNIFGASWGTCSGDSHWLDEREPTRALANAPVRCRVPAGLRYRNRVSTPRAGPRT